MDNKRLKELKKWPVSQRIMLEHWIGDYPEFSRILEQFTIGDYDGGQELPQVKNSLFYII